MKIRKTHMSHKRRRGFVLVTVVILLAITSLLLVQLAIRSLGEARQVLVEQREFRQRWAVTSLRSLIATRGESFLGKTVASREYLLQIAEKTWLVVVSDESAKFHLPSLSRQRPTADVRRTVSQLLPSYCQASLTRKPLFNDRKQLLLPNQWEAWFDYPQRNSRRIVSQQLSQNFTLWGAGQLNLSRASDETINAVWGLLLGRQAPAVVLTIGDGSQKADWQDLKQNLGLRESELALVDRFFSTSSASLSAWILPADDDDASGVYFFVFGQGVGPTAADSVGLVY